MITRFVPAAPSRPTRPTRPLISNRFSEIRGARDLPFTHPATHPHPPGGPSTNSLNLLKGWVRWVGRANFHRVAEPKIAVAVGIDAALRCLESRGLLRGQAQ
jgi:hypothetical protein